MTCIHCGRALAADARFCEGCGRPVAAPSPPPAPPAPPGPGRGGCGWTPVILVLGCGVLFLGLAVVGLGLWWWVGTRGGLPVPTPAASSSPGETPELPAGEPGQAETPEPPPELPGTRTPPPASADPGPVEEAPPGRGQVLFEDRGDLDGDGREERAQVVALDGTLDPTRAAPRTLRVVKPDGSVVFETEAFEEPFRPDLDELASEPWNRAGIHAVAGAGRWPDLRLVFAPASGNYAVFRYDGTTWQVVESGD